MSRLEDAERLLREFHDDSYELVPAVLGDVYMCMACGGKAVDQEDIEHGPDCIVGETSTFLDAAPAPEPDAHDALPCGWCDRPYGMHGADGILDHTFLYPDAQADRRWHVAHTGSNYAVCGCRDGLHKYEEHLSAWQTTADLLNAQAEAVRELVAALDNLRWQADSLATRCAICRAIKPNPEHHDGCAIPLAQAILAKHRQPSPPPTSEPVDWAPQGGTQ